MCQYANHGVKLLTNEKKRKEILGISADEVVKVIIGSNIFANIAFNAAKTIVNEMEQAPANKQESVIEEVEADIRVLEHYLIYGIFEASGFGVFCQQELDNLRDCFLDVDNEGYWAGIVGVEWREGNPELLKELPPILQTFKFDTEVSDNLKQLRVSLDSVHNI
ncbi:hypothetical protein CRENPOLYSF2_3650001 [Crenothrix polyspora]|uniref:Uncharacterized protein n=1 Tax=Crenothrix polyspora TaxID=360316 RepID=A0A1R4HC60_9GAMM|nr:hypothetical protein [Crenothrix polyspora]SJM93842.1 hypothetical protein CRENPOLYSF2_3650001 [Crenothrix polyspora]